VSCHCTVGAGLPAAAATKDTTLPALTLWLVGFGDFHVRDSYGGARRDSEAVSPALMPAGVTEMVDRDGSAVVTVSV